MGNEAASVATLYCDGTPIKADYDVDKVTQQIALIQPPQESTVSNGAAENIFLVELMCLVSGLLRATCNVIDSFEPLQLSMSS